tara:strand:- start:1096 stop:1299 length:204 start_codon:yes stop_codon:yes gene_type:complete
MWYLTGDFIIKERERSADMQRSFREAPEVEIMLSVLGGEVRGTNYSASWEAMQKHFELMRRFISRLA